jgi:MYXO-CTERM domain-containing protein
VRDDDCGPAALCCDDACAAVDACEPASPTTGGPGSSSGGETPTTGAATTSGSTSTGTGEAPEARFEPGDAGCACDADDRGGADMAAGMLVLTMLLRRRRRGTRPTAAL